MVTVILLATLLTASAQEAPKPQEPVPVVFGERGSAPSGWTVPLYDIRRPLMTVRGEQVLKRPRPRAQVGIALGAIALSAAAGIGGAAITADRSWRVDGRR